MSIIPQDKLLVIGDNSNLVLYEYKKYAFYKLDRYQFRTFRRNSTVMTDELFDYDVFSGNCNIAISGVPSLIALKTRNIPS